MEQASSTTVVNGWIGDGQPWKPEQTQWHVFPTVQPYIGDPIEEPYKVPVVPGKADFVPYTPAINTTSIVSWWPHGSVTLAPAWRVNVTADGTTASCDVPGARDPNDVNVIFLDGTVTVSYKRFDTGDFCVVGSQFLAHDCDPATLSALLEAGVLTVSVKKLPPKFGQRVTVVVK